MIHELKTDPEMFQATYKGFKTFEIRKDDRGYKENDELLLRETLYTGEEMKAGKPLHYTGRELIAIVIHILRGPVYGLAGGWCIMSVSLKTAISRKCDCIAGLVYHGGGYGFSSIPVGDEKKRKIKLDWQFFFCPQCGRPVR